MATGFTAEELVREIREEVQIFGVEPLADGFPDDTPARDAATRILPALNKAKSEMHEWFITKCWFTYTLVPGHLSYRLPETDYVNEDGEETEGFPFGFIEEALIVDNSSGRISPLDITSNASEGADHPFRQNTGTRRRRPFAIWTEGDSFGFDVAPDSAYTLRMLVDTEPPDMAGREEKPKRLPRRLQRGLITGGAYYIARKALAMPAAQSVVEGRFLRYKELKEEWYGKWKKSALELSNGRFVHDVRGVSAVGINGGW
jgi:hypothetical protein